MADTRRNPPLHSDGLETALVPFSIEKKACFWHFFLTLWVLRQLLAFPRNKHLLWNHSISFHKCQNNWNPPQSAFKIFSILHLLSQPVPEVCQSSHYKITCVCVCVYIHMHLSPFLLSPSHPHRDSLHIKLLCFLLTLSRLFCYIVGHRHDGLFIAFEQIFLLSSHLFCLLHIFLNLHFLIDKSMNTL